MGLVYVDNSASTMVRPEVMDVMKACSVHYGNPSCLHSMGEDSRKLIDTARAQVAKSIGAKANDIIFTSGGTESNNLAILGFAEANGHIGNHIITTQIEHASVLRPAKYLRSYGYDVTCLPVDHEGAISIRQLQRAIRKDTILISVMFANNETGSLQPIREIGEIARLYNICFHTDAVQAFGHCDMDVNKLGVDMLSISGHKVYAPKGVGVLYAREGLEISPIIHGSGQEYGLRSGTENLDSIVGMGKASELLCNATHLPELKNKFIDGVRSKIPRIKLNGSVKNGLDSIVNISFYGISGETLVMMLDEHGICASSSSTCLSSHSNPSHVLTAMGVDDDLAYGSIRFSFGIYNTDDDVACILEVLPDLVEKIRSEST